MGKKKKSAKASGFSIKRSLGAFNCSWKLSGNKAKGQQWRQKITVVSNKKSRWPSKGTKISTKTSKKAIKVDPNDYWPVKTTRLKAVAFQVREKNKNWSGWKGAQFMLGLPQCPAITKEQTAAYSTKFTITLPKFLNDKRWWTTHVQWWTCLRIDKDDINHKTIDTDDAWVKMDRYKIRDNVTGRDTTTFEPVVIETDDDVRRIRAAEKSAVRWVKAVAQGPRGDSTPAVACITYTKSLPVLSLDSQISVNPNGGYDCTVGWACINSIANPIDYMTIEYTFAEPYGTEMEPSSPSPQEAQIGGDNKIVPEKAEIAYIEPPDDEDDYIFLIEDEEDEADFDDDDPAALAVVNPAINDYLKYIVSFRISETASDDKLLYLRVNTYHNNIPSEGKWILCNKDSNGNETIPLATVLAAPQGLNVELPSSPESNLITVNVTNASNVEDVYIVIRWIPEEGASGEEDIAVFEVEEGNNSFSEAVEIPASYTGKYAIGAYAAVGPYKKYSLTEDTTVQQGKDYYTRSATEPYTYEKVVNPPAGSNPHNLKWYEQIIPERKSDRYNSYGLIDPIMKSKVIHYGGEVPIAPNKLNTTHIGDGNVLVEWEWNWKDADTAEIAWSDYSRALESTEQPSTYEVTNINKASLIVKDLEMGKTWYFWARFIKRGTASQWSEVSQIAVNSAPQIPVVEVSNNFITLDTKLTVKWDYISTDGTEQKSAVVATGSLIDGSFVADGQTLAWIPDPKDTSSNSRANSVTIDPSASDINWNVGEEYYIAVNVKSDSDRESGWSEPVKVSVVNPLVCEINMEETSLELIPDVDEKETHHRLVSMPFDVKVDGATDENETHIYIRRADNYPIDRPDGSSEDGPKGELVYYANHKGSDAFIITVEDVRNYYGYLDDTAEYTLYVEVTDNYGQIESDEVNFYVQWEHQAQPMADEDGNFYAYVVPDNDLKICKITIDDIPNWEEGDVCDIYRLTVDEIQLIYEGAVPGDTIVDMYPTLGRYGGHRIAYRSMYGDFITADDEPAYIDIEYEHGDYIESSTHIIDFGVDRVELEYNVDLSTQWKKDFKETKYLGGSIRGDWNDNVSRTGSINAAFVTNNADTIRSMRKLAGYASECIVRTTDGSHYVANIDVSESLPHGEYYNDDDLVKSGSYSLSITRVDSDNIGMGVTEAEWEEMNRDEEDEDEEEMEG